MDNTTLNMLISTSGSVIVGVFGMFFTASQLGRRIDDTNNRLSELRVEVKEFRSDFYAFKELVNGKFAALDLEIARLMDRPK